MQTGTILSGVYDSKGTMASGRSMLVALLSLLLIGLWGCAKNSANGTASASWQVPELKERTAGLDAGDFVKVKEQAESFRAVLKGNSNDIKALVGLAQIFMYEGRVTGDHPYYYPAAEGLLDRALTIDPNDYQAVISKASVLLSLHRFSDALTFAQKAVELSPNTAAGYGALVDAYVELGRYEEGVKAADRMVAVRPDLKSYSRVSYLREIHGDVEGAVESMRLAVDAGAPGSEEKAWAQTTLGNLYLEEGRLNDAEREFKMAALERDNYPFALAGLARLLVAKKMNDSALSVLDRAIELVPEFSFIELQADIHRASGNNRVADSLLAVVETMLREDEESGHAMDREIALLYAKHGIKLDEALTRARRELEHRPDNIDALDAMAYVLVRSGKPQEAKEYAEKAQRMGTRKGSMIAHVAMIERGLGNEAKARSLAREAMALNPHLPPLLRRQMEMVVGS